MAYMQTKGLYKSLLDKEVLMPEVTPLTEAATADERAEWAAQVEQRNQQIKEIDERKNNVWCHIALARDKISLMYIRHDLFVPRWNG